MSATVSKKNTRITFTTEKNLKSKVEECAKKERRSISNLINVALIEYINKNRRTL